MWVTAGILFLAAIEPEIHMGAIPPGYHAKVVKNDTIQELKSLLAVGRR